MSSSGAKRYTVEDCLELEIHGEITHKHFAGEIFGTARCTTVYMRT